MAVDYTQISQDTQKAAQNVRDATVGYLLQNGLPGFICDWIGSTAYALMIIGRSLYKLSIFAFVSIGTSIVTAVLQVIKQIRADGAADFAEVTGEAMGEFMAIDAGQVDFKAGNTPDAALKRAQQLGGLFVDMMQGQFGKSGPQTPDAGESAAKALAGYGINFATSNTFLSWLIELSTDGKFGDFDKLGEDIARAIGLGRLTRQALRPLVRNAIEHPYDRKMRATYRADLIAPPELVKGFIAGRISEADCDQWLAEHGLSDAFIAETKAQHTPSLHPADIEELIGMGAIDATTGAGQLKEQGIPDSIAAWQLQILGYKRLGTVRNRILTEVLSQIAQGFTPLTEMALTCQRLGVAADESKLWVDAAGTVAENPRKRLSEVNMLFLYEAAQVTDSDVQTFLEAEGYSSADVQNMLSLFRLKAAAAAQKSSAGSAAKAADLHNEHTAYVTDEITGLWGRAPTKAELNYWVTLLDTAQRTKHDFVTELKTLDTSGPAIPPH